MQTTKPLRKKRPFVTTGRDIQVVQLIYACGWLNTTQIIKVMFPPEPTTGKLHQLWSAQGQRRLKHLKDNGFLNTVIPLIEVGRGKDPNIYYAGKRAYEGELVEGAVIPKPEVWTKYYRHDKAIRDVFTDMLRAAAISGTSVPAFKSTRTLKGEYQAYIPDWYLSLAFDNGNPFHIFLEVDRGEETEKQWKHKMEAIEDYRTSPEYKSVYVHGRARWATITTTQEREAVMRRWSEETECGPQFWFTTYDRLTPCTALTEPIWSVCTQEGLYPLSKVRR